MKRVVLASASKRRDRILTDCGIAHIVRPAAVEELFVQDMPTADLVKKNAELKALATAGERVEDAVVIGADTLVRLGDELIGKPENEQKALELLEKLSGAEVEVFTGLFVIDTGTGRSSTISQRSVLYPTDLTNGELEKYFDFLGPYDKAGGFSIEGPGGLVFDDIRGSYFNILGLPLGGLRKVLKDIGIDILDLIEPGSACE